MVNAPEPALDDVSLLPSSPVTAATASLVAPEAACKAALAFRPLDDVVLGQAAMSEDTPAIAL